MNKPLGLYVHIPFCVRKCAYCDFYSIGGAGSDTVEAYVSSLCAEISAAATDADGRTLTSIFFGGGTPSYLSPDAIGRVMESIRCGFAIADDAEITLETNPGTVTRESLAELRRIGVNRLSIGVQSFDDRELAALGRIHTADEAETCIRAARDAGFRNISIDLMYAIPHQNRESFARSLRRAVSLGVDHISAYSLIIEPGTRFWPDGGEFRGLLPGEDAELEIYRDTVSFLSENGYGHYEISNYAHKGCECRHNMLYWSCDDYIGVGAAASSYFAGVRYKNAEDICEYIAALESGARHPACPCEREKISPEEAEREYIMLSLRTSGGIRTDEFRHRFGVGFYEKYGESVERLRRLSSGLIEVGKDALCLTDEGMYLSNSVIGSLI